MNAAEQANDFERTRKIAAVVNLFKLTFPDARADLRPWANDPETQDWIDPESIDIGFHFPGVSRSLQCRSLLVQIHCHGDRQTPHHRMIGAEVRGFDHRGEQWRLSTIAHWQFLGNTQPAADVGDRLKQFCQQAFLLFNQEPFDVQD